MKHALIIVGEEIQINESFLHYVFSEYESYYGELGVVRYIADNDMDLPFSIENAARSFDVVTIVANDENFATTSKILATLTNDNIELKFDTFVPSRALKFEKDSVVIALNRAKINLVRAIPTKKLPPFITDESQKCFFFNLLDIDKNSARAMLEPMSSTYNVTTWFSDVAPSLTFVKAKTDKFGQIGGFIDAASELFGSKLVPEKSIVEYLAKRLIAKNLTITFAESCTAGLAAAKLGAISGVSEVFAGSVVTYANRIKHAWLDVEDEILETKGAVSAECVEQMCRGAMELCQSDFAIAISGIAGPNGGSEEKPVGTVFIGAANKERVVTRRLSLAGDRNYIREQSALGAYALLIRSFREQLA